MPMKLLRILLLPGLLLAAVTAAAQTDHISAKKRTIDSLEKKIAAEEREIAKLQKGRAASEERARRLARQIDSRNQLIESTENEASELRSEIARTNSLADSLETALGKLREQYASMAREAYRNYRHNNYLTYLFASRDFADAARRMTTLRQVAALRERKLRDIAALTVQVQEQQEVLTRRNHELDSVSKSLTAQRAKLQRDASSARASISQLTRQEKSALRRKEQQEQQLSVAISELRKLTKGNKEGASFSAGTSGLRLPVTSGRVKRYKGNMAEIVGPKGAKVISIYDGKVVEVKQNRITGKYDVFVAHGEYITSYANLGSVAVAKGQKIAKNGTLGVIGSSVDVVTMETEYKLIFGIYAPDPSTQMLAANCFK